MYRFRARRDIKRGLPSQRRRPCATTPEQQKQVGCVGATVAGAALGGAVGNQFGGGSGKDILTAGGAVAGGIAANNAAGC